MGNAIAAVLERVVKVLPRGRAAQASRMSAMDPPSAGPMQAQDTARLFAATVDMCRVQLIERWNRAQEMDQRALQQSGVRRVHYLSMEFLMGRALGNALAALGLAQRAQELALAQGLQLGDVLEQEADAALGNGGLGRLAACFLDALAESGAPSFGYGLRYQYGMFAQRIVQGRQVEVPDDWLRLGNAWEVARPEVCYVVGFGGQVYNIDGKRLWIPAQRVLAQAFDFIVPAHHSKRVSTLRQWHACAEQGIDFGKFCRGDFLAAAQQRVSADVLNWVLYPDDSTEQGRRLRLRQEAFLVSATLQDLIARHIREGRSVAQLGLSNAIHLNDTHPALVPAELMRLLLDEHALPWDAAWAIVQASVSYTNHTLMAEALETWPVALFEELLPRHLEIICRINHDFLEAVRVQFPGDAQLIERVSLIEERPERRIRMAALAIVASRKVNGVSALHSELMVQTIFADFARLFPERFHNITNGVTPRRWLMQANHGLSGLIDASIGRAWRKDLMQLSALRSFASDSTLGQDFRVVKRHNKERLALRIAQEAGVRVDPDSLFDVQTKRIHEYKRQLLNILHVIARYQAILERPQAPWVARTVIIAGKAASAYQMAKLIIELAHGVAEVVNRDPAVAGLLKLVFLPNYGVSLAECIIPAADLSEQISTAGTEASGTGNMKFALNGALTMGTWDGANIEMAQAIGEENLFIFGLRAQDVQDLRVAGYQPREHLEGNAQLRAVLDAISAGLFSHGDTQRYRILVESLLHEDRYMLMADFPDYVAAQERVDRLFAEPRDWSRRALLNVAGMGAFSADRTIRSYLDRVWAYPVSAP